MTWEKHKNKTKTYNMQKINKVSVTMQQILYLVGSHHPDTFPPLDSFWCMIWLWFWSHVPFFVHNLKP